MNKISNPNQADTMQLTIIEDRRGDAIHSVVNSGSSCSNIKAQALASIEAIEAEMRPTSLYSLESMTARKMNSMIAPGIINPLLNAPIESTDQTVDRSASLKRNHSMIQDSDNSTRGKDQALTSL